MFQNATSCLLFSSFVDVMIPSIESQTVRNSVSVPDTSIIGLVRFGQLVDKTGRAKADKNDSVSLSAKNDVTTTEKSPPDKAVVEKVDFTDMTRQEMWDWMNDRIASGEMSLDGTENLASMYVLTNIGEDQLGLNSRVQTERINFFDAIQNSIDFYSARGHQEGVQSWQHTLNILQQAQGQVTRVDARV